MNDNGRVIVSKPFDPDHAEMIEWLWKYRLVKSAFNLIIGEEKVGKGTFMAWLISQLTRGGLRNPITRVAVIGYEDSWTKVWAPRLKVLETNRGFVHELTLGGGGQISIRKDHDLLVSTLKELRVKVLYIDQLLDNLSLETSAYNQKEVRDDLSPIHALTERGITVIGTMHPNKKGSTFREWQAGSAAFTSIARSTLALCKHPDDETRRVIAVARSNYGELGHGLTFGIESAPVMVRNSRGRQVRSSIGKVVNVEPCDFTVDEILGGTQGVRGQRQGELERLLQSLIGADGGRKSTEVLAVCADAGFGSQMVRRAAKRLGVQVVRSRDKSVWNLK